ncbi:cytochrome P450 [Fomitopsis serialis]|uniref:cytochrome P450 n=1 Tax=Fomitopsis serialis TaxID=139415 RepID=UPI0020089FE2|nr:cytochrome P450 [Neoantrodia serialis]KAH9915332.1 cytochrome P450 [Neoantrodia serialis]
MIVFIQSQVLPSAGVALLIYVLWKVARILLAPLWSTLRDLPGPASPSLIYGNLSDIHKADDSVLHEAWVEEHGPTITYKGWLNSHKLYTLDTRALGHILSHSHDYAKPAMDAFFLGKIVGQGLLVVEGDQHRQQRRVMNPAFGYAQIRGLTEIFVEKAQQLRDFWSDQIAVAGAPARIDVTAGLGKMTLDVIGLAGFNYDFNALDDKPNELNQAFTTMFQAITSASTGLAVVLKYAFPILDIIPDSFAKGTNTAQAVARRVGMQLIQDKKAEVMRTSDEKGVGDALGSRDLLTLLIKANMSTDIPVSQRLSDEDVLAQVPTFLIAGHETTSYGTGWALFALAQAPLIQRKLREELLGVQTDTPSMDELNALPYLDAVVRETMRLHAPVPATARVACKDDMIPLNTPYTDRHGQVHDHVKHTDSDTDSRSEPTQALWGEDAFEFKPERWEKLPEAVQSIPGVWGNLMTFIGGPRACIGYRFSLVEMKALLFVLVRAFELELALPANDIIKKSAIVQRPYIRDQVERGSQLPLLFKPYQNV